MNQSSNSDSNKALILDFDSQKMQQLFFSEPFGVSTGEGVNKELWEGFLREIEKHDVVVHIYAKTFSSHKETIEEILEAIFDSRKPYKIIYSIPLLFMALGILLDKKYSVIVYSSDKCFIPDEIYQELGVTDKSKMAIQVRDPSMLKSFTIKDFKNSFCISDKILSEMCLEKEEKSYSDVNFNFGSKEEIMGKKSDIITFSEEKSQIQSWSPEDDRLNDEKGMPVVPISKFTSIKSKSSDIGNYEIFQDLLMKLWNKKREKSKEFSKLIAYISNTVEHHLLKFTHMNAEERQNFFLYAFQTLWKKQWLRGKLPDLIMSLPPSSL